MARATIPLEQYLERIAFGESPPPPGYYSDSMRKKWGWVDDTRRAAWESICKRASEGWLVIHAIRYVKDAKASATWYPDAPASTVPERVPADFFLWPVRLGVGGPEGMSFLYHGDRKNGSIFNAPWANPVVLTDKFDDSRRDVPSHRPPEQRAKAIAVLKSLSDDVLHGKKAALIATVNERLKADGKTPVSKRTIERAREDLFSGKGA